VYITHVVPNVVALAVLYAAGKNLSLSFSSSY
jgi:hypothetical protein